MELVIGTKGELIESAAVPVDGAWIETREYTDRVVCLYDGHGNWTMWSYDRVVQLLELISEEF